MEIFMIVLEFFFIILLQLIGIGFHVMQKVLIYDKQYPDLSMNEIFAVFKKEDWPSLLISALVLFFDVVAHAIIHIWQPELTLTTFWIFPYVIWSFIIATILGYAGQRIAYAFLGKAADRLEKIASKIDTQGS